METLNQLIIEWGVASLTLAGEGESGDKHAVKVFPHGALLAAADGLGHGEEAAVAANMAVEVLQTSDNESIISLLKRCHERLRSTRGVVISLASFNAVDETMTWIGVGNVEGVLLRADPSVDPGSESLALRNGVVGSRLPLLHAAIIPVMRGDTLIFATDGIRSGFTQGLDMSDRPQQIADRILAQYAKRTDDALVLVARYGGRGAMNAPRLDLKDQYTRTLQDYLAATGETNLHCAYELGRRALDEGLGVLEMASLHHHALATVEAGVRAPEERRNILEAAGNFFAEALSPFEMTHRGFRETNMALRQSEERYRSLVENAQDVIYTLSAEGTITSLNPCFEAITGWPLADWTGKPFPPLVHPDDLPVALEFFQRVLHGETPPLFELRVRAKSGAYIPGEFTQTPLVKDGQVVGVLGIGRDITERKRGQEALRRLNQTLEDEAKRIAHALHDGAGQLLASVYIALEGIARDLPPSAGPRLKEVRTLLDQIEVQLRRLSHELRPTILDDLGLIPALEFLSEGVSKRTKLQVTVAGAPIGRFAAPVEMALYRIVQEALNNATRHAQASRATVQLEQNGHLIRCLISDDGIGFDVPAVLSRKGRTGLGLIGIRERLNAIGGAYRIISAPGQGTTLQVEITLEAHDATQDPISR
jgi:PAS domain S-box-containing protein